jgi:hypothetical protein
MKMKLKKVYAVSKEPLRDAESYPQRFLGKIFERRNDAVQALPDLAREYVRAARIHYSGPAYPIIQINGASCFIEWQNGDGFEQFENKELRIEELTIAEGRVVFKNGVATVNSSDWRRVLIKDLECEDWDARTWADHFVEAARDNPDQIQELLGKCDWWKFIGVNKMETGHCPGFLVACPWFMEHEECADIEVAEYEWPFILMRHPEFSKRCTTWNGISGSQWREILSKAPRLASKCDWKKLEGGDWVALLKKRPRFEERCDWNLLSGWLWVELLKSRPKFATHCDWSKLSGADWARLLESRPEFAKMCDVTKLSDSECAELLQTQPQLFGPINAIHSHKPA